MSETLETISDYDFDAGELELAEAEFPVQEVEPFFLKTTIDVSQVDFKSTVLHQSNPGLDS